MARKDADTSLEIAQGHDISEKLGSCYFRIGEVNMLFGEFDKAVDNYQKAQENYQGTNAERGDYRYHLGEALYRSGNRQEGKEVLLQGLKEIEENEKEVDPFLFHVWQSGCYMRLAELLKDDEPEKAKEYISKAHQIAESDDKLIIRKRQIAEIVKSIKSSN